ncbi:MAG: hypothetical protein FGM15_10745 [Chthoniobacterales bacterium]|nr:hypothetical protein [Chthoniobacterales bacterium]
MLRGVAFSPMSPDILRACACFAVLVAAPCMAVEQTFRYEDAAASKVEIAGEFNDWKAAPMESSADGVWSITLDLPAGTYGYKFLVNGDAWMLDPANPDRKEVDGNENSAVTVGEGAAAPVDQASGGSPPDIDGSDPVATAPGTWTFTYAAPEAQAVFVAGSFNGWNTTANPLSEAGNGVWTTTVSLPAGQTAYKFIVDGEWKTDPANPALAEDGSGGNNSVVTIGDAAEGVDSLPSGSPDESSAPTETEAATPAAESAPEQSATPVSSPEPAAKTFQFAGSPLVAGQSNIVEIPVTNSGLLMFLEKAYGKPSNKAKALLVLPAGFEPSSSYPVVIESATTDGNGSSIDGAEPYLGTVREKGVVLLAVDGEFGKPEGGGDSTTFRWALVEAALQQMQKEWPSSKTWPLITAGISGGAGYASYNAIMLVNKRYPIIGMFLANSGYSPVHFAEELKRAPDAAMRKVPVFMTAGDTDTIAIKEITEAARDAAKKERFRNVRYETFPGGHELSPSLFAASIDWFVEQSKQ